METSLFTTIVAIIGALAWLPQVIKWIAQWRTKPVLKIFNENEAQAGYIYFGSVININLSFLARKKSALIDNISIEIVGDDKASCNLQWNWYSETFYELKGTDNNSVTMSKQQKAIAINAYRDVLVEKFIGFQSPTFMQERNRLEALIIEDIENKKKAGGDYSLVKSEKSYNDLLKLIEKSMYWKPGNYTGAIKLCDSENCREYTHRIKFSISDVDINNMKNNIEFSKKLIESTFFPKEGETGQVQGKWYWVNLKLSNN